MDEQTRHTLLDDLKGFIRGELLFDDLSRVLHSTDASIFQIRPLGVVAPLDEEDVAALVRYAAEHRLALIPRGAGTGVAGEALGSGLIVDLSRHLRRILEVGSDTIRVQPGVTCTEVNNRLAALGRRIGPDPASADQCTIGGMLATNASGARALQHGYMRDHAHQVGLVLDSGDVVRVGREQLHAEGRLPHLQDILTALGVLLEQHAELIQTCRPRTRFNRCGYLLQNVLEGDIVDLPRLLIGSEGTLGVFTEATLRTLPLPAGRAVVLLGLGSLDSALRAVEVALPGGPSACELIDRRLLSLARGSDAADVTALIPAGAEAVVLLEYESAEAAGAAAAAHALVQQLTRCERLTVQTVVATEPAEIERLWRLRQVALPSLYALHSGIQPIPIIEDVGVPVEELSSYLVRVQDILKELETTASFLIHAGTGQVHARPFLDLHNPQDVAKMSELAERVHSLALELGGTVSSQHGTGLARGPWVARQHGSLYPLLRQVKAIFDPQNIFNPGKIVDPAPTWASWPLRQLPVPVAREWVLRWTDDQVRRETLKCNGCGQCRQESAGQRMCPVFHATHGEAAAPRAKANLLRQLLLEPAALPGLGSDEVRAVADLCVGCRMCAFECPARVNIPRLMLETKAANVLEHGLDRQDWFFARVEDFCRWGNRFPLLANLTLGSRWGRWLLEKLFGLSRQRRLPRFTGRTFLRLARRRGWSRRKKGDRPQVAYFVDLFANYHDTLLGEAAVLVLQHNGFDVYVPPEQRSCGMAALTQGDVESARDLARHNLKYLAEAARAGLPIICSEPSAALALGHDYLDLLDDSDARLVAGQVVELTTFLGNLHWQGKLNTDFRPLELTVGHHVPCHLKALGQPAAGPGLLSLIPGMSVCIIDVSCSGMAGTWGLRSEQREASLAAGQRMLDELRQPQVKHGSTECSTCRLQMEDAGGKRTLHPVQYLALAYGLLPEIHRRLQEPLGELTLR